MVDRDVLARKLALASARLGDLDELLAQPKSAFLDERRDRDLAAFYFQLAVQECVDLASHWVADADWTPPDTAGSAFDTLADHRVIDRDLATLLRQAVGLRNLIAHGYGTLDPGRFYDEVRVAGPGLRRFLGILAEAACD